MQEQVLVLVRGYSPIELKEKYRHGWWLSNGRVAWEIPTGRIAAWYADSLYLPPEGWKVLPQPGSDWRMTEFGNMVKVGL